MDSIDTISFINYIILIIIDLAEQDQNQNDTSIYKDTESNYDIDEDFESQSENVIFYLLNYA